MPLSHLKIIRIMRWGDFNGTCTKFGSDKIIFYDLYFTEYQWKD